MTPRPAGRTAAGEGRGRRGDGFWEDTRTGRDGMGCRSRRCGGSKCCGVRERGLTGWEELRHRVRPLPGTCSHRGSVGWGGGYACVREQHQSCFSSGVRVWDSGLCPARLGYSRCAPRCACSKDVAALELFVVYELHGGIFEFDLIACVAFSILSILQQLSLKPPRY